MPGRRGPEGGVGGAVPLLPGMRALLVVAGVLVVLAGVQLFLGSERTATWFAWTIDLPLTAAFLGASYWAAAVIEWTAASRRLWADARIAVPGVLLFTTLTLVVTVVHLDAFHLGAEHGAATRAVTWAWVAVYAVVPVLLAVLWWRQSLVPGARPPRTAPQPALLRAALALQAVVLLPAGAWLLLAPATAAWWPWPLPPLAGRAVGAWLVSLGVVAVHALLERDSRRIRPAAAGSLALVALQVVALVRYGDVLDGALPTALYLTTLATFVVTGVVPWLPPARRR